MAKRTTTRKPQTLKVGECPCGKPIMIAERYAVSLTGPTTINRKCDGYRCGRINAVVVSTTYTVQRATWDVFDCRCGGVIRLRSDYTGGPGWTGYDAEGKDILTSMSERDSEKNRTVKIDCPRCDCKYTIVVRFTKTDDGMRRNLSESKVRRCDGCRHRAPVGQAG